MEVWSPTTHQVIVVKLWNVLGEILKRDELALLGIGMGIGVGTCAPSGKKEKEQQSNRATAEHVVK